MRTSSLAKFLMEMKPIAENARAIADNGVVSAGERLLARTIVVMFERLEELLKEK